MAGSPARPQQSLIAKAVKNVVTIDVQREDDTKLVAWLAETGQSGLVIFHPAPDHLDRLLHRHLESQVNRAGLPLPRPPGRPPAIPALPTLVDLVHLDDHVSSDHEASGLLGVQLS